MQNIKQVIFLLPVLLFFFYAVSFSRQIKYAEIHILSRPALFTGSISLCHFNVCEVSVYFLRPDNDSANFQSQKNKTGKKGNRPKEMNN